MRDQCLYFFSLWLKKRLLGEVEIYFFTYRRELARKGDPDIFALDALLALVED